MEEVTKMEAHPNEPIKNDRPESLPAGGRELCFGAAIVVAAMCLANFLIYGGFRLGYAIAMTAVLGISWGYLHLSGCKGNWYTRSILILCMVISAGFLRSDDGFVKFVMVLFLFVGGNVALANMAGQNRFQPGGARSLFDAPRTATRFGFGKMGQSVRGVGDAFRSGGTLTRRSGAVLAGVAIAIPMLAVVIPLLISADAAFDGLVGLLPHFEASELVITVLYGGALALFYYSRAVGLKHAPVEQPAQKERKGLNSLTINTALAAVCVVYLVYMFSQLAYFVGGFAGILPVGYSAAEYARRGFFEMTLLCAIDLGIITFAIGMVSRQERAPRSTRLLCLFIGLVTLFFVAAFAGKMGLYIGTYGLTRLRVMTMVIMAFLAVTTVMVCVWLFVPRLQYMKAVMLVGLALGAAVIWTDIDTQVAKYNVSAYLDGDLETVDFTHLRGLGNGAVPYIAQLTRCGDKAVEQEARQILDEWYVWYDGDWRGWDMVTARALEYVENRYVRYD